MIRMMIENMDSKEHFDKISDGYEEQGIGN
jgi:hypothetical protein